MTGVGDRPTRRVTIREVAERSGVSVSAVSKVLRDAYGVSPDLRARVTASIDELKYRPLTAARGMRGHTFVVGVVLPDVRNPFLADVLHGLSAGLNATRYDWIFGLVEGSSSERAVVESMIDRQVDGIVVVGTEQSLQDLEELGERLPLVAIGCHASASSGFDTVNNDDVLGARLAVGHLASFGYRRIAMLSLAMTASSIVSKREQGYRLEMVERGLAEHVDIVRSPHRPKELLQSAGALLGSDRRPDAVFCWSDFAAFHLTSVALDMGLRGSRDLGIVGYDNSALCELAQNALSSVDQAGGSLGQHAARLMMERLSGRRDPAHVLVEPSLVTRPSSVH